MGTRLSRAANIAPEASINVDTASSRMLRHLFSVVTLDAFAEGQSVTVSESSDGQAMFSRQDGQTLSGRWVNRRIVTQPDP